MVIQVNIKKFKTDKATTCKIVKKHSIMRTHKSFPSLLYVK